MIWKLLPYLAIITLSIPKSFASSQDKSAIAATTTASKPTTGPSGVGKGVELQISKKEGKQVLLHSKKSDEAAWISMSIIDGVPLFEIKEREKEAKTRFQLALTEIFEERNNDGKFSLYGSQQYWTDISTEVVENERDGKVILLRASLVRPESDLAGNFFTLLLEASIRAHDLSQSPSITLKTTIQNYPYPLKASTGLLMLNQIIAASIEFDSKKCTAQGDEIAFGTMGKLIILSDSAIEDGDPTRLAPFKTFEAKESRPKCIADAKAHRLVQVQFSSQRPKNATFVEHLVLTSGALKLVPAGAIAESKESPEKVNAMTVNNGQPLLLNTGLALLFLTLALLSSLL